MTIFLTKHLDQGTPKQTILETLCELHEEGDVKGLTSFQLMGSENPMSNISAEAIKYDRKTVIMKDKKPEQKEKIRTDGEHVP